jgi:hypothetical protein
MIENMYVPTGRPVLEIVIEGESILAPGGLLALNRWSHPTLTPRADRTDV